MRHRLFPHPRACCASDAPFSGCQQEKGEYMVFLKSYRSFLRKAPVLGEDIYKAAEEPCHSAGVPSQKEVANPFRGHRL
jgi:hypothetical protein